MCTFTCIYYIYFTTSFIHDLLHRHIYLFIIIVLNGNSYGRNSKSHSRKASGVDAADEKETFSGEGLKSIKESE